MNSPRHFTDRFLRMAVTKLLRGPGAVAKAGQAIICVGLELEANIASRRFQIGFSGLADELTGLGDRAVGADCKGLVSFGVAGGLSNELRSGDVIVASQIVTNNRIFTTDDLWSAWLLSAIPNSIYAPLAGLDAAVLAGAARAELGACSGAVAIDTESHTVAGYAARHGMPFVSLRIIIDGTHRNVPPAALACISNDGATEMRQLGRLLLARPADILDVMLLWVDWLSARKSLIACCEALDRSVGELELCVSESLRRIRR
jgi:adenosylhomocysteine nucleosidase